MLFVKKKKATPNMTVERPSIFDNDIFSKYRENDGTRIGWQTNLSFIDLPTAYKLVDADTNLVLPNGGLFPRIITVIGESETGKTSLCVQLGGIIGGMIDQASYIHIDAEGNLTPERILSLTHWSEREYAEKCLYVPPSPPIDINGVYDIVRRIAHTKDTWGEKAKIETPYRNVYTGKKIKCFPPTIIFLDSIKSVSSASALAEIVDGDKNFSSMDKIDSNITGARDAKDITSFLKKVKPVIDEYNIIFVIINHISKEMPISMFDKPKKYHPLLKPGEKLYGGIEMIFQCSNIMRLSQKEHIDDKNPIYGDLVRGYVCNLQHIKNKTNESSSQQYSYVFDKSYGVRPELTDFEYLYDQKNGLIQGSAVNMYLSILPEIKFSRKTLLEKCFREPILARALSFCVQATLGHVMLNENGDPIDFKTLERLSYARRVNYIMTGSIWYNNYLEEHISETDVNLVDSVSYYGRSYTGMEHNYVHPVNSDYYNRRIRMNGRGYTQVPTYKVGNKSKKK